MKLVVPNSIKDVKVKKLAEATLAKLINCEAKVIEVTEKHKPLMAQACQDEINAIKPLAEYLSNIVGFELTPKIYKNYDGAECFGEGLDMTLPINDYKTSITFRKDYSSYKGEAKLYVNFSMGSGLSNSQYANVIYNGYLLAENPTPLVEEFLDKAVAREKSQREFQNELGMIPANSTKQNLEDIIMFYYQRVAPTPSYRHLVKTEFIKIKQSLKRDDVMPESKDLYNPDIEKMDDETTVGDILEYLKNYEKPKYWKSICEDFENYITRSMS